MPRLWYYVFMGEGFERVSRGAGREQDESREKLPVVYHAVSYTKTSELIEEFQPRSKHRDYPEEEVLFAANDKEAATMFLVDSDDSWVGKSRFGDVYCEIISDEERWREADKGGRVYALPAEKFVCEFQKGWGRCEVVSREPVKPIAMWTKEYDSAVDAMVGSGVQVYFVDKETFRDIRRAEDKGLSILRGMQSENQKRGVNVSPLKEI